jgi:hypothetical protein
VAVIGGGTALNTVNFSSDFCLVSELSAAPIVETVAELGDGLAYLSRDGFIYRLTGGTKSYTAERLCEARYSGSDFAVAFGERYICFHGINATVVEMVGGKPSVGCWSFPTNLTGGFSHRGSPILFSGLRAGGVSILYMLRFGFGEDRYLVAKGTFEEETEQPVEARFSFSLFEESRHAVRLIRLRIDGSGEGMTVTVSGEEGPESRHRASVVQGMATVLCGKVARHPRITVAFRKGELSGVAAEYRRLQKL